MKILGNNHQIRSIKKLILNKQFPNSLILSGLKGVGKSLIAKNVSLSLVEAIQTDRIDHLNNESSHNILYISKEKLFGKKQIKQLIYRSDIAHINNFFKTRNENNMKRVCIIDSIDELSLDAINSLLKIIEEPNINSHFIIISHDYRKLLPSIISRSYQIKFNNFTKEDFTSIIKLEDEFNRSNHTYLYELSRGSINFARKFIDNNFIDIDQHLQKIYEDKNNIKSNTAYHYINFLNEKGGERNLIIFFFDYLILKKSYFIRNKINELHLNNVNALMKILDELIILRDRYITFNLSFEHILIHYFNRLRQ